MDVNQTHRTERFTERIAHHPTTRRVKELPQKSLRRFSSDVFLWGAGISVVLSLGLRIAGRREDAIFVGEWVPSILLLGVLTRV